ncbi:MAG: hypothetical protein J5915_03035, partial [Acidaminococcaceae bacterium]|nr:hypothetical protein [Acidaminococcaceae bacterium]
SLFHSPFVFLQFSDFVTSFSDKRTSVTVLIPLFAFSLTTHWPPWQHPPSLSTTANPRHPFRAWRYRISAFSSRMKIPFIVQALKFFLLNIIIVAKFRVMSM